MKFYLKDNASVPLGAIEFTPYAITGGTLFGVFATDKPDEIAFLDAKVAAKLLNEITSEDYAACLKKKRPGYNESRFSKPIENTSPEVSIAGPVAKVVSEKAGVAPDAPIALKPIENADDALKVSAVAEPVNIPVPVAEVEAPVAVPISPEPIPATPARKAGKSQPK